MRTRDKIAWTIFLVAVVLNYTGWGSGSVKPPLITAPGLHVAFITDRLNPTYLADPRSGIPSEDAIRDYCNEVCSKDAQGQSNWRLIDKSDDLTTLTPDWQAMAKEGLKTSPPTIVAVNGRKWSAISLQENSDKVREFLKAYQ